MTTNKNQFTTAVIEGKLRYAQVLVPRPNFNGQLSYSLEVEVNDNLVNQLRNLGLSRNTKVRTDEKGTKYLKFVSGTSKTDGTPIKIPVVDANGNDITDMIANGSTGKVKVTFFPGQGQFGGTARLTALVVTNLIPYTPDPMTEEEKKAKALDGLLDSKTSSNSGNSFI